MSKNNHLSDTSFDLGMSGPLRFRFTNDYLFRATLQTSELALKGLVCARSHGIIHGRYP